jgi:hypothetical protein
VAEGHYQLVFEVAKNGVKDTQVLPITVSRNPAILSASSNEAARFVAAGAKRVEPSTPTAAGASATLPPPVAAAPPDGSAPLSSLGERDPKPVVPVPVDAARPGYFVASKVIGRGVLRDGPGRSHRVVGEIAAGERFPILERRLAEGETTPWYRLRLDSGAEAWAAGALGEEVVE